MQATDGESDCLFVYGTLMGQSRHPMAIRLAGESTPLGAATVCGRLYTLGAYPGLVPSSLPREKVYGAVLKLRQPSRSLRWLDAYEGCGEQDAEPHSFKRVIVRARLMAGRAVHSWIYLYQGPLDNARRLHSGRYSPAKALLRLHS